ncbi:uncharacterized protein [Battus philenor]|uniref:uncharacterized protein n=1 Tax=Battus philenor TaxID=42288 RepID=UPI0035D0F505
MKTKNNVVAQISNRIVNSMKPSLFVEYCYGIFRYRINGQSLKPIDLRMKIIAFIITSLWISIAYIVCVIPKVKILFGDRVVLVNVVYALPWVVIGFHYAGTNFAMMIFHTENNKKLLEIFAKIDISLQANVNDQFYKTSRFECKKLIIIYIFFCVAMVTLNYFYKVEIDITDLLFMLIYFERKIELVVFFEIMFFLRQRLLLIRNYFIKFLSDRNHQISYTSKTIMKNVKLDKHVNFIGRLYDGNNKILDLATAYNNLGEAYALINNIYNMLIIMTIVSAFIFILAVFWTSLNFLKIKRNVQIVRMLLKAVVWSIAELCSIVIISYYCAKVLEAKKEIQSVLNNLLIHGNLPKNIRQQAKVFVELTEIWPMTFYVSNMFQVNKKLVLKFISICTSYLIVVIQFNDLI